MKNGTEKLSLDSMTEFIMNQYLVTKEGHHQPIFPSDPTGELRNLKCSLGLAASYLASSMNLLRMKVCTCVHPAPHSFNCTRFLLALYI